MGLLISEDGLIYQDPKGKSNPIDSPAVTEESFVYFLSEFISGSGNLLILLDADK